MGDERNEFVYEINEAVEGVRDLCMESHYEYGTRAGWPRIRQMLTRYGVKATLNACGRAARLFALACGAGRRGRARGRGPRLALGAPRPHERGAGARR